MARPNRPSLVFPNGGEEILTRVIEVTWEEPAPVSNDGTAVYYEIYYCDNYDNYDEPDWQMIAMIPSGSNTYLWEIGNYLRSENVRVAINSVNARGERSDLSISAEDIFIKRALPPTPAVLSPVPGGRYGRSVQIVFDDSAIRGTFGQRAKYFAFFSSDKAGIPLSPVAQKIPIGTGPIVWDTSLLKPADDYILTVYLSDDDGNKSAEVNVRDISILNEGFFLIDTKPPSGFVQINDGEEFTREQDVSVKLFAFDETTGAHSMQFQEGDEAGPAEAIANLKYVTLSEEDGVKTLKVLFQDFGANRTSEIERKFRILFDIDNEDIGDIIYQTPDDIVWLGYNGPEPALYKSDAQGFSFAARINEPINALGVLNGVVYVGVDTPDDTALVYRFTGGGIEQVISLTEMETEILSMGTYKGNLYLGSLNGDLYFYDETAISLLTQFSNPIDRIYSDGSLLYILLRNSSSIQIYDGTQFVEVEL